MRPSCQALRTYRLSSIPKREIATTCPDRRNLICRLLDDLVGAREQRRRNVETERFRGVEIDHQIKLGGKLNWQTGRFSAFENLSSIDSGRAMRVHRARAVTDQSAADNKLARSIDRRYFVTRRQRDDSIIHLVEYWIGSNKERVDL